MSIPDFESIMRPLLIHLSDGKEHGTEETLDVLAKEFGLTEEERRRLLPSGRQGLFRNRVAWAKFFLKKAGAVETTRRGIYRITDRGLSLLGSTKSIDAAALQQFPEFKAFILSSRRGTLAGENSEAAVVHEMKSGRGKEPPQPPESTYTPEELISLGHSQLAEQLSTELLERIKAASPEFFERLVVELLLALGYGGSRQDAGQIVGRSGDEGIDGVIKEDRLGLDTIYLQAKRWEAPVGRPEIQKFAGALQGQNALKGVFITTSTFTAEAQTFVSALKTKIVLIDGNLLTRLMIEHNVGVTPVASYDIKRIDSDYFSEE